MDRSLRLVIFLPMGFFNAPSPSALSLLHISCSGSPDNLILHSLLLFLFCYEATTKLGFTVDFI